MIKDSFFGGAGSPQSTKKSFLIQLKFLNICFCVKITLTGPSPPVGRTDRSLSR